MSILKINLSFIKTFPFIQASNTSSGLLEEAGLLAIQLDTKTSSSGNNSIATLVAAATKVVFAKTEQLTEAANAEKEGMSFPAHL